MKEDILDLLKRLQYDFCLVEEAFPVIKELKQVCQNPAFHGEGDVYHHTQCVCEELKKLPQWQWLDDEEKGILYLAAFFHDIGKKLCTKAEEGVLVSPKHAVAGAKLFRQICFLEYEKMYTVRFRVREEIAGLIRYHGLPPLFMEKRNPELAVLQAGETVRLPLLYLLAKADSLGRICREGEQFLERVEYFKEYATELGCYNSKFHFSNPYTRFRYFNHESVWYRDRLYDSTEFPVFMMAGLPLAGKDTYIEENLPDLPVVSLDQIREEWGLGPQEHTRAVVSRARDLAKEYLRKKQPFVWNATNIIQDTRRGLITLFENYGARVMVIYVEAPYEELMKRNQVRKRTVDSSVIMKMLQKMDMVNPVEGYEVTYMVNRLEV